MPDPYGIPGLERCEDCRKVCICPGPECQCMIIDAAAAVLLCHSCTDVRDHGLTPWSQLDTVLPTRSDVPA